MLLARKRQQTYRARRRSKELLTSSPTYEDIGISREYADCRTQYEWHLACLHCGETQRPRITHYQWQERDASTVVYVCEHCGGVHTLADEHRVKAGGRWVRVRDDGAQSVGYWFAQWGSPFARWADTVQEWIDAQGDSAKMQAVTNTVFAEGWEGVGDRADPHVLSARAEDYGCEVPDGVLLITMGVDCQQDRLEAEIVGWGAGRESWSLAYEVLPGEPTAADVWSDLLELYRTPLRRADGTAMEIASCCVDSGAYSQHVYEAVKRAKSRWVIPIKGVGGMTRAQIDTDHRAAARRAGKRIRSGAHPEPLGVDSIKRTVYQYLAADLGKPGYCHFPLGRDDEYYQQLTGERLVVVSQRGRRPERRWVPIHPAVEALDCRVYAYAAMLLRGPDWESLTRARDRAEEPNSGNKHQAEGSPAQNTFLSPRSGWLTK
jgi:phage terminase large subunit GpA-like protein